MYGRYDARADGRVYLYVIRTGPRVCGRPAPREECGRTRSQLSSIPDCETARPERLAPLYGIARPRGAFPIPHPRRARVARRAAEYTIPAAAAVHRRRDPVA